MAGAAMAALLDQLDRLVDRCTCLDWVLPMPAGEGPRRSRAELVERKRFYKSKEPGVRISGRFYEGKQPKEELPLPAWVESHKAGVTEASKTTQIKQLEDFYRSGVLSLVEFADARERIMRTPTPQDMSRANSMRSVTSLPRGGASHALQQTLSAVRNSLGRGKRYPLPPPPPTPEQIAAADFNGGHVRPIPVGSYSARPNPAKAGAQHPSMASSRAGHGGSDHADRVTIATGERAVSGHSVASDRATVGQATARRAAAGRARPGDRHAASSRSLASDAATVGSESHARSRSLASDAATVGNDINRGRSLASDAATIASHGSHPLGRSGRSDLATVAGSNSSSNSSSSSTAIASTAATAGGGRFFEDAGESGESDESDSDEFVSADIPPPPASPPPATHSSAPASTTTSSARVQRLVDITRPFSQMLRDRAQVAQPPPPPPPAPPTNLPRALRTRAKQEAFRKSTGAASLASRGIVPSDSSSSDLSDDDDDDDEEANAHGFSEDDSRSSVSSAVPPPPSGQQRRPRHNLRA